MPSAPAQSLAGPLRGVCRVPADKAISHRAAILGALADGRSRIESFSRAGDCRSTLGALSALGVSLRLDGSTLWVDGAGAVRPAPEARADCGRSGTTMRLLAGALAGGPGPVILDGEEQLRRRPMDRVVQPLRAMGALIEAAEDDRPPLRVAGGHLQGIRWHLPVASAQAKSAVLLAGLRAEGATTVGEPAQSRDHTERLLAAMGARLSRSDGPSGPVTVEPGPLHPLALDIPGDPSSAAARLGAGALVPGSDVTVKAVSANPTRSGLLAVLEGMGAQVELEPLPSRGSPELAADVRVRQAPLHSALIGAAEIPALIDELPLLAVLATQAEGTTEVHGAGELRVKESDRISGVVAGLRALGAAVEEYPDGFAIRGPQPLAGGRCDSLGDHRLAMAFSLAGLAAAGPVEVTSMERVSDSFPGFEAQLQALLR